MTHGKMFYYKLNLGYSYDPKRKKLIGTSYEDKQENIEGGKYVSFYGSYSVLDEIFTLSNYTLNKRYSIYEGVEKILTGENGDIVLHGPSEQFDLHISQNFAQIKYYGNGSQFLDEQTFGKDWNTENNEWEFIPTKKVYIMLKDRIEFLEYSQNYILVRKYLYN